MIRRWIAASFIALSCAGPAFAQAPSSKPAADPVGDLFTVEPTESDPNKAAVYGYFAFGLIAGGILFVVCKSSRRG